MVDFNADYHRMIVDMVEHGYTEDVTQACPKYTYLHKQNTIIFFYRDGRFSYLRQKQFDAECIKGNSIAELREFLKIF